MLCDGDYKRAIDVHNACNLSGVVFSFAQVMQGICDEAYELGKGTEWKNNHPIAVLYIDKMSSLCGVQGISAKSWRVSQAYAACKEKAKKV